MADISNVSAANPYRNVPYKKSFWQRVLGGLGFRTEADAWKENMQVQANEYDAQVAQMEFQNQFNSPSEEATRLRGAGINPDLQGLNDVAQAASPFDDPSTPMQSTGNEAEIKNFVSGVIGCFSTALGMVNTFQGIHKSALENRMLGFQADKDVTDYGLNLAPTFLTPLGDSLDIDQHLSDAYDRASLFASKNLPRRYRDKFSNAVKNFYESAPGEADAYQKWYDSVVNQKKYYSESNTFYTPSPKLMKKMYSMLGSVEEHLWKMSKTKEGSQLESETAKAEYDAAVLDGLDPNKEASAKVAGFQAQKNQFDLTNYLRGTVNEMINILKNDQSEFAGLYSFLLRMFSLYMYAR